MLGVNFQQIFEHTRNRQKVISLAETEQRRKQNRRNVIIIMVSPHYFPFIIATLCFVTKKVNAAAFSIAGSGCAIVTDDTLTSLNFPAPYSPFDNCSVITLIDGILTATAFDTEEKFDVLVISPLGESSSSYSGTLGPTNIFLHQGSSITWSSDESNVASGWSLNLDPAPLQSNLFFAIGSGVWR